MLSGFTLLPICVYCEKRHGGECRKKLGASFHYGSRDHFLRECPHSLSVAHAPAPAPTPAMACRHYRVSRSVTGMVNVLVTDYFVRFVPFMSYPSVVPPISVLLDLYPAPCQDRFKSQDTYVLLELCEPFSLCICTSLTPVNFEDEISFREGDL
ncbi:hypothetical protein GQ457_04G018920 [Hibiscus cannabinus]